VALLNPAIAVDFIRSIAVIGIIAGLSLSPALHYRPARNLPQSARYERLRDSICFPKTLFLIYFTAVLCLGNDLSGPLSGFDVPIKTDEFFCCLKRLRSTHKEGLMDQRGEYGVAVF
jgi:hypothetical protein